MHVCMNIRRFNAFNRHSRYGIRISPEADTQSVISRLCVMSTKLRSRKYSFVV
jgi:hypothetical protein